jgi:Bacterial antitoxin of ParD toxin-antitoxin type II system and RHH
MPSKNSPSVLGEDSGSSTPFDFEPFIARKRNEKPKTR